jgi:predicted CoA-binding protein
MPATPPAIEDFLRGRRIAVAGVSRSGSQPANAIFRKLRGAGYEVFAVNPNAPELEGVRAFPDLAAIPGPIDGVIVATHPSVAPSIGQQALAAGVRRLWFHRSFGEGSVSAEAVTACRQAGATCIVGGCPMMYCAPDPAHRCMRWWLEHTGRITA